MLTRAMRGQDIRDVFLGVVCRVLWGDAKMQVMLVMLWICPSKPSSASGMHQAIVGSLAPFCPIVFAAYILGEDSSAISVVFVPRTCVSGN